VTGTELLNRPSVAATASADEGNNAGHCHQERLAATAVRVPAITVVRHEPVLSFFPELTELRTPEEAPR
jgi:hypothetical protein